MRSRHPPESSVTGHPPVRPLLQVSSSCLYSCPSPEGRSATTLLLLSKTHSMARSNPHPRASSPPLGRSDPQSVNPSPLDHLRTRPRRPVAPLRLSLRQYAPHLRAHWHARPSRPLGSAPSADLPALPARLPCARTLPWTAARRYPSDRIAAENPSSSCTAWDGQPPACDRPSRSACATSDRRERRPNPRRESPKSPPP